MNTSAVFALIATMSLLSMPSIARAKPADGRLEQANELLQSQADAQAFVREVNDTIDLAKQGAYGSIKEEDVTRLNQAQQTIVSLLKNRTSSMELSPDHRIEVYNAQEEITAILRNDEKGRIVCQKIKTIGTRVTKRECLTVAEREARGRAARDTTRKMMHESCVKTDHLTAGGNRCTNIAL